ncbi:putative transposase, partial [Acinetobacter baumannii 26016_7]
AVCRFAAQWSASGKHHDFNPVSKAEWLDPYAYLSDVLKRLPTHKVPQIEELLPHRWKPEPR